MTRGSEKGRRVRRAALAALPLLPALAAAAAAGGRVPGGTAFVTERQLGSLTAYDTATGQPRWTTMVGASPIGVTQPRGTARVYTSDEGANQMSVLDRDTGALLRTIAMGPLPHHLMASGSGRYIYVGEFGHNEVGVVDTRWDLRVAGWVTSPLPEARTHAVWIAPNGRDLYATNSRADRSQPGDVAKLDARTGALLCNTTVGADPSEILATPDGRTGYVSVRRENRIKELDLGGACPVLTGREAVIGTMPDTLQLTRDRRTLVVTLRGTPAQISLLDTDTFAVQLVDIPGHTTTGHHWLSASGRYSFVAVENPAGLAVVDNRTAAVVADHPYPAPPGGTRAHGVFYLRRVLGSEDAGGDDYQ
jgi:DNA-binding beta-propeller fold protein YncE